MSDTVDNKRAAKRTRRMARETKPACQETASAAISTTDVEAVEAKPGSKSSLVLAMLDRPEGATIAQLVAATDWLHHTTRAALTALKKKGNEITSSKAEGEERVYRVVAG